MRVNVRRLAALDMYGARGTMRRRRIILAEFILGTAAALALGIWIATSAPSLGGRLAGLWVIGVGLNYVALAAYAWLLYRRPGALDAELAGADTARELRRYSLLQLWVFVPLSLVALSAADAIGRRGLRAGFGVGYGR